MNPSMSEEQLRTWAIAHSIGDQFMPQAVAVLALLNKVRALQDDLCATNTRLTNLEYNTARKQEIFR